MFSYSGDPSTSLLDEIRFYSQDIDESDPLVSDEEISYLIVNWEKVSASPLFLAAVVCDVIAAKFTRELSFSADGISVGAAELQNKFVALADSLRSQYQAQDIGGIPTAGGMIAGEVFDETISPLVWAKGQHDNPNAGFQDAGGYGTYVGYPERDGTYL